MQSIFLKYYKEYICIFLNFQKKFMDHKMDKVWSFWVKKKNSSCLNLKNLGKQHNKAHELKDWCIMKKTQNERKK